MFIQSHTQSDIHHAVVESTLVCATSSLTEALVSLFICHYVFNLEYATWSKMFLLFVQMFLVGINDDNSKLPAKLRSFLAKINAVAKRSV